MPTHWANERWEGGRKYLTTRGRTVYVIRRQVQGTRYEIPLDAQTRCQRDLTSRRRRRGAERRPLTASALADGQALGSLYQ